MYPKITATEIASELAVLASSLVPRAMFLHGAPGIGKSAIFVQAGQDQELKAFAWKQWERDTKREAPRKADGSYLDLDVIQVVLPQHEPEDFVGVPFHKIVRWSHGQEAEAVYEDKMTCLAPMEIFRREFPYILFLDEVSAAEARIQKVLLQIVNERKIATTSLTPGTVITMAGNRANDRANTKTLLFTLGNRAAHYEMVVAKEPWLEYESKVMGIPMELLSFFAQHGESKLMAFDPADPSLAQATPRSNEAALLTYMRGREMGWSEERLERLLVANIGVRVGTELSAFLRLRLEVASWDEIVANPDEARLPQAHADRIYYSMGLLVDAMGAKDLSDAHRSAGVRYLARLVEANPQATDAAAWFADSLIFVNKAGGQTAAGGPGPSMKLSLEIGKHPVLAAKLRGFMASVVNHR